jgi:integrase
MYIVRKRRLFYALMTVPPSLRAVIGKARFTASLGTDNLQIAKRRAAAKEAGWLAELEQARHGRQVDTAAEWWRKALEDAPDDYQKALVRDQIATEAQQRVDRVATRRGFIDEREDGYDVAMEAELAEAQRFVQGATGQLVPFDVHLDAWIATLNEEAKTSDMKRTAVREFAKVFPMVQDVAKKGVQKWADGLLAGGLKRATVGRKISELKGYWAYLIQQDVVAEDHLPLEKITLPKASAKQINGDNRQPFETADVVRLLQLAVDNGDQQLADLIELARWTGARLEELAAMKVTQVRRTAGHVDHFDITDAKTQAGWRQVPVHSKLALTVHRLVKDSKEGYLLSGLTVTKYGDRGGAISKRFGRLKTAEGFGPAHVFHSIRKTVATLLENAGVPENVAADIIGHDKPTMTYGLYSGGASLAVKREAIEKLRY